MQAEPLKKKWFHNFSYTNRRHITTIIRLRTGHCLTGEMLHKLNIKEDPYCECGLTENLNHIFFECSINAIPGLDLYTFFIKELKFISAPLTIFNVLNTPTEQSTDIIIKYLNHNKMKL